MICLKQLTIVWLTNIASSLIFFPDINISSKKIIFCKNNIIIFEIWLEEIFIFSVSIEIKLLSSKYWYKFGLKFEWSKIDFAIISKEEESLLLKLEEAEENKYFDDYAFGMLAYREDAIDSHLEAMCASSEWNE